MAGILGIGIALMIVGLVALLIIPWGIGVVVALVGLLLVVGFAAGFGRRATEPRPRH